MRRVVGLASVMAILMTSIRRQLIGKEAEMAKSKLDTLDSGTLMLAYLCIKDVEDSPAQVQILDRFRLSDKEIATISGAAVGSVRNARVKYKKGSKKGGP